MQSELFFSELQALAYFNYCVTFPFLHFVEVSSQEDLLNTLPKLYNDFLEKNPDTLKDFVVPMRRITVPMPTSEIVKHLVDLMCTKGAAGILMCG